MSNIEKIRPNLQKILINLLLKKIKIVDAETDIIKLVKNIIDNE